MFASHWINRDVAKAVLNLVNGQHREWANKEENEHHVEAGEEVVMDLTTALANEVGGNGSPVA